MSLILSGNLKKPDGSALGAAEIVFHAVRTSSGVPEGVIAEFQTDLQGNYTATVEFGRYDIYVRADNARAHTRVAKNALIDANTTETDLNSLVLQWQSEQDITPEIVVEFRDIQADVQANRDEVDALTTHVNNQTLHVDQQVNHVDSQVAHVDSQVTFVDGRANDADASAVSAASSEAAAAASETAAANSEGNALASETAARSSEVAAAGSASAASTSETNAKASETAAATSETNAAASETAAAASEANAAASESAAASSASSADTSESWAEKWAQNPYNTAVKTGQYSSLHHATVADSHRAAALQSAVDASNARTGAETAESNAKASETAAAASESAAATSETNAAASESAAAASQSAAATSETNAKASETAAAASESAAAASETNASASESAAASSASAAATSETNAQASEDEAEQWATSLTLVDGVSYGAKKYAQDAAASESAAATSESNAAASEAAAATSETNAAASESAAATSETNAAASETAAASSASAASTSETNAKASETAAAGSASAAATSETNAAASESAAASSASAAATSEANAASSASAAASSESAASMSANSAATSEANAAASESAAASSEALAQAWATQTNAPVSGDLYGAKYYADQARTTITGTLVYRGTWDATTPLPGSPKTGDLWKVSVASGQYNVGDQIIYNGTGWDHIDNTEQVTSVGGNVGDITDIQLREAVKRVDGPGSGLDADLLDGHQANEFQLIMPTGQKSNLAAGWYTIAINRGDRAIARFGIRDTDSSDHQAVVFYASHHFGAHSELTLLHSGRYNGNPLRYVRIKEGSTYDGAMLQVYIDQDSNNHVQAFLYGENFQASGWTIKDWVPDGTDPGGLNNFSALTNTAAQLDLNNTLDGGMATTGEIYAGGNTTQYKVWHAGNDGPGSGLNADVLDGKQLATIESEYQAAADAAQAAAESTSTGALTTHKSSGDHDGRYVQLDANQTINGAKTFSQPIGIGGSLAQAEDVTFDGSTDTGLRVSNSNGYISLTPLNSGWAHIYTDRPVFIFNKPVSTTSNIFRSYDGDLILSRVTTTKLTLGDLSATFSTGVTAPSFSGDGSGLTAVDADLLDGQHASAFAQASHNHAWADITDPPTSFPPEGHTHPWTEVTSKPATATRWPSWSEVTSKPGAFTPAAHNHSADEITSGVLAYARIPTIRHGDTNFANQALNTGSSVQHAKVRTGGAVDDGTNSLQVQGGTRTDTLAAGSVQAPTESIETDGNVKVHGEGQMQMGDFAIQYNAATKSLDFNWIGG